MSATEASGAVRARTTSTAKKQRNSGLSTLPIQVKISPGRSEKKSTAAKNTSEKMASASVWPVAGSSRWMPTV